MNKDELKKRLTPLQWEITQNKATERPFTGIYCTTDEEGMYHCICCDAKLFDSKSKFFSGCGWPAFMSDVGNVDFKDDYSHNMYRIEILCKVCGAHLGHIFDEDTATGKRYCVNSGSINFKK
jgi:peptide-methionine (R)-S-oxide reductase